jgi:hypothetical protein
MNGKKEEVFLTGTHINICCGAQMGHHNISLGGTTYQKRQWRSGEITFKKCLNDSHVTAMSVLMTAL